MLLPTAEAQRSKLRVIVALLFSTWKGAQRAARQGELKSTTAAELLQSGLKDPSTSGRAGIGILLISVSFPCVTPELNSVGSSK